MNFDYYRYRLRGWLYALLGKPQLAYGAYANAFRHHPEAHGLAYRLAIIAATQKNYGDARDWFREALRRQADNADAWFNLGFVLEAGGESAAAIDAFEAAIRVRPTHDRAWYGIGIALARRGDHAAAAKAFHEVAKLQPLNGNAWYQLGMASAHGDDAATLEMAIERLQAFDPKTCDHLIRDCGRKHEAPMAPT